MRRAEHAGPMEARVPHENGLDAASPDFAPVDESLATLQEIASPGLSALFRRPRRLGRPSGWWGHVPFAGWLVQATQPRLLVELGTYHGVSYAAFCEAVLHGGLATRCYAVDHWRGDAHAGPAGEAVYHELRAFNALHYGAFSELLREDFDSASERFEDGSIDLLHIDGFHTYEAVRHDYERWRPKLSASAVVLFHDTNVWRDDFGVHRLFAELAAAHPHFEFLHGHGLGVLAVGSRVPPAVHQLCSAARTRATLTIRDRFACLGARWETLAREEEARGSFEQQVQALRQAHQHELESTRLQTQERRDAVLLAQRERDVALGRVFLLQTRLEEVRSDAARRPDEGQPRGAGSPGLAAESTPERARAMAQLREQLDRSESERAAAMARVADLASGLQQAGAQRDRLAHELARSGEHHERARAWTAALLRERAGLAEGHARLQAHAVQVTTLFTQMFAALLRRHEEVVGEGSTQPPAAGEPVPSVRRRLWQSWRPRRAPAGLRWLRPWARAWRAARHEVARTVRRSMLFDADWYVATYPDIRGIGMDPAYHYAVFGGREGRDPSPWFSTRGYLALNQDVAVAGVNALYHFEVHGLREGRALASLITSLVGASPAPGPSDAWAPASAEPAALAAAPPLASADARERLMAASEAALDRFLAAGERLCIGSTQVPQVSVIVVLHNRAGLTYGCLRSLQACSDVPFELIVVDNASTDRTAQLLERLDGCQVLRQDENLHFLRAANLGARHARGGHLLFLNNDTLPEAASLGAASRLLDEMPDAGAVGGAIVLPDGRLQEAGAIIWRDGSCSGFGRGQDPDAPAYAFRRDVDYCSGAFLMVRRSVFEKLGGFDPLFAPAYYEDTDLCMRIREAGLRVIYEPRVRLVHAESASAPSAQASQALMRANQVHFARRHARTLAEAHAAPGDDPFQAAMRRVPAGKVLFVDDRVPDPALGAGNGRAAVLLRCLHEANVFVTHCPLAEVPQDRSAAQALLPPTTELAPGGTAGLQRLLAGRAGFYDAVIVSRPHNMQHWQSALAHAPRWPADTPVVYDAEAIFALREHLRQDVLGIPEAGGEPARELEAELDLARAAAVVLTVNEAEAAHFRKRGQRDVRVLGHAVPRADRGGGIAARAGFLFVGRLAEENSPNADSVRWFVHEVMPHLDRLIGDGYGVDLVGLCHPELAQAVSGPRVRCHGRVQDLAPRYAQARVFIAPTRFAAGIPLKVHEAAAHGLPVVATGLLARQLGWRDGVHLLAADTAEAFARACARAYTDAALWERLRQEALSRVAVDCDPAGFRSAVRELVRHVIPQAAAEAPAPAQPPDADAGGQARTVQTWSMPPAQRVEEQGLFWMAHPQVARRLNEKASGSADRDGVGYLRARLEAAGWTFPLARVASLGCGFGALERGLAALGWARRIDGYDLAEPAVQAARREAAASGLDSLHYHVCDLEREPLPEAAFDAVFGSHSVHHIEDLDGLFASVRRALRPGGIFYLQEYVGPDRFQWTDAQLDAINAYLASLPAHYRRLPSGFDFRQAARPSVEAVIAVDPSEAIRSSAILPALARHFRIMECRELGGALLQTGLSGIAQNFDPDDAQDAAHLHRLFDMEDRLMAQGVVGSDFVHVIAVRDDTHG